ncbi:Protein arginine N-methyltransferase 3 [Clonorchis sinensis]|uniref:Conserved oligomeric Golgi complex subunit 7 n=1 Tax=Clonorchis sinensis TaxID=79923 RepID=A0A8T1LVH1_CLOSI|nr:Protein arginine N-methyltransferase 3 [Clonorchis sinensis]
MSDLEDSSASATDGDSDGWTELIDTDSPDTNPPMKCLVCPHLSSGSEQFFTHLLSHPNWENLFVPGTCLIMDQYDWIRFVNYVRLKKPTDWRQVFHDPEWNSKSEESFLSVLENDAVLSIDIESVLEEHGAKHTGVSSCNPDNSSDHVDIKYLWAENAALRQQLVECKRFLAKVLDQPLSQDGIVALNDVDPLQTTQQPMSQPTKYHEFAEDAGDSAYFTSYGHFAIHGEMITDQVRTESYRTFILSNADAYFAGKRVLDVGCGSAILSLFAAEAGADHVYGVEASTDIFAAALETIRINKMDDRITLLRDRAESVKLPVDQVDVIISEWMGYFLLFESMLDSVLTVARRYLKPSTGCIFPRHYTLNLLGISCGSKLRHDHLDLWTNVYGYQMPALRRSALAEAHVLDLTDPRTIGVTQNVARSSELCILTSKPHRIYSLDLKEVLSNGTQPTDLLQLGERPFSLLIDRDNLESTMILDALVGYFDVRFDDDAPVKVEFSTSPTTKPTHWKQTVFFLDKPMRVRAGDLITGSLTIRRSVRDSRGLEFSLRIDALRDQPDLSPFLDPQFDHKQWINEVLTATTGDHNVEQQASELVLQLQAQMKEVMQSIERSCQEAVHCVPRLLREVDTLKIDAIALGNELAAMRDNISQVDSTGEQIITQLAELDRARRNAHAAANALRETDRWSSLVLGIGELLEAGEMDQVCCNIEGMEQCLTALTHLPDYKDRVQLVAQHKNSLESLVAPQLIRALGETVPGPGPPADASPRWPSGASFEAKHLVSLLYRIGREGAASNYYTNWIKSCVLSIWEQCCSSNPSLDPVSDTYRFFTLLTNPPKDPFCAQLDADSSTPVGEQIILTVFYAQLLHLINNQLATHLFPDLQSVKVMGAFTEALKDLTERRRILIMGSAPQSKPPQVDHVANLLMITLNCCAQFGRVIDSQVPGIFAETSSIPDAERKGVHEMALQLCRTLLDPFGNFGELFGKETRGLFEAELSKVNLTDAPRATPEFVECLSQTMAAVIQLINTTIRRCFDISMGIGIPYLLSIIQSFLDSFLAKWTIAIERSAEPFITADAKSGFSQNSGLTCALHLASLTGELSLQSHSFVEAVLTKSADLFARILSDTESSPFFSAGEFPRESLWQSTQSFTSADWILLRLLVECHPTAYQNTVRLLAHPSTTTTVTKPVDPVQDGTGNVGMQATLSGLHRSHVTACRAAVSLVRRVALAPISQVLNTVPTMPVWSFMPGSGEAKFPDLAYLPQDYITQIGQYLLALPEHLEPYMSEIGTDAESEQHISGRGLAECLHLGDPDAASMALIANKPPGPQEETGDSSKLTPRRRLTSLSLPGGHKSQQGERSVETFTSAAFCWLESFVSGAVCELLLTTWLRIGGNLPNKEQSQKKKKRPISSGHRTKPDLSDSESELEDHVHLTEHGAKQLTVDLDYLQNLLEDMGLSFPGNLQALRELISCSPNEFAELSADRPPRIVSALERLRGL